MVRIKIPKEHKEHASKLKSKGHIWENQKGRKQTRRLNTRIDIAKQFALLSEHGFNISKFKKDLRKVDIASSQLMKQLLAKCFPSGKIPDDIKARSAITRIVNIMRFKYYWELAENRLAAESNKIIYNSLKILGEEKDNAVKAVGKQLNMLERNGFNVETFIQNLTENSTLYAQHGPYSEWTEQLITKCSPRKTTAEQQSKIKNALKAIQYVFFCSLQVRKGRADYYNSDAAKLKAGFKRKISED